METKQKLEEARDILSALLDSNRCPATLVRCHWLVESAIADLFADQNDVATIPLGCDRTPFPAE